MSRGPCYPWHDTEKDTRSFMEWRKCRKKAIVVEAREATPGESIETREGKLVAQPGDLIIRGVEGELYPIGRAIFDKTYDWVD